MDKIEKAYWNHEVSARLEIGESTLRKWCIELEKNGYTFIKGAMDSRAFTDHDLAALTYFKQLTKGKKHTKEQAAKMVVDKFAKKGENERTTPVPSMENTQSVEELAAMVKSLQEKLVKQEEFNKALLEQQDAFNKQLLQQLDQQNRYIKDYIQKKDQLLLETIRQSQDEKAAALEKKKKPWLINKWFGK